MSLKSTQFICTSEVFPPQHTQNIKNELGRLDSSLDDLLVEEETSEVMEQQ